MLLACLLVACQDSGGSGSAPAAATAPDAAQAASAEPAWEETRVLVYGDSLWDVGDVPGTCDLCKVFPDDIAVTNYASGGAEIWPLPDCDGLDASGAQRLPDPACRNGANRALPLAIDADPANDVCGGAVLGWPTCIADNPEHEVLLIQFGTNEVRSSSLSNGAQWGLDADEYALWLEEMLLARPAGMACALVVPPPIWSSGYETYNERLEQVAEIVHDAADRHGCEVADLLHRYLEIEDTVGDGATLPFYYGCAEKGSRVGDCVHYSVQRPAAAVEEIVDAIDRADAAR